MFLACAQARQRQWQAPSEPAPCGGVPLHNGTTAARAQRSAAPAGPTGPQCGGGGGGAGGGPPEATHRVLGGQVLRLQVGLHVGGEVVEARAQQAGLGGAPAAPGSGPGQAAGGPQGRPKQVASPPSGAKGGWGACRRAGVLARRPITRSQEGVEGRGLLVGLVRRCCCRCSCRRLRAQAAGACMARRAAGGAASPSRRPCPRALPDGRRRATCQRNVSRVTAGPAAPPRPLLHPSGASPPASARKRFG
jgi:hypothetical protein